MKLIQMWKKDLFSLKRSTLLKSLYLQFPFSKREVLLSAKIHSSVFRFFLKRPSFTHHSHTLYHYNLQKMHFYCRVFKLFSDTKRLPRLNPLTLICRQNETRILNPTLSDAHISVLGMYEISPYFTSECLICIFKYHI